MPQETPGDPYDYDTPATPTKGSNELAQLSNLAEQQLNAEAAVAQAELELEKANKALAVIQLKALPEFMAECHLDFIRTPDGTEIEIVEKLHVQLAKIRNAEGITWLEDNNHGGSVKRQIVISFNKEDEAWAKKFLRDCAQRKKPLNMVRTDSIHNQTLKKLVKGLLEQGVEVPLELFGVHRHKESNIKSAAGE